MACNLVYPTNEPEREEWSFCDILARSLCPNQTTPAWCDKCGKFTPTSQARNLQVFFLLLQQIKLTFLKKNSMFKYAQSISNYDCFEQVRKLIFTY